MSYSAVYTASKDAEFQGRCLVAARDAAADILAEDPQTANHPIRRAWAVNVLRGKQSITPEALALQVLRNPTIAADVAAATDANLKFAVVSYINDLIELG